MLYLFLLLIIVLFLSGISIFFTSRHIILVFIGLEVMLLGVNFGFIIFSLYNYDIIGYISFIVILTVAGCESALGLALLLTYYKNRNNIEMDLFNILKG